MALADITDVSVFLGRAIEGDEVQRVNLLLDLATADIRAAAGQTLTAVTGDAVKLAGTWSRDLELPERPVTAVSSVAVNGETLASGSYVWNERSLIRRSGGFQLGSFDEPDYWPEDATAHPHWQGAGFEQGGHWGGPESTVDVTYDHGFTAPTIPAELKALCLRMTVAGLSSPGGNIRQETVGAYSVTYDSVGAQLSDKERRRLRRRFGSSVSTIVPSR